MADDPITHQILLALRENARKAKPRRRVGSSVNLMPAPSPGQTYKEIVLSDGRRAIVRVPDWHDLDDLLTFINELVQEHAEILIAAKVTRNDEAEWLGKRLAAIENGNLLALIAEIDRKIVASSDIGYLAPENPEQNHIGVLGIVISKNARGIGLGTRLIELLLHLAKQVGLKVIILDMFATNTTCETSL